MSSNMPFNVSGRPSRLGFGVSDAVGPEFVVAIEAVVNICSEFSMELLVARCVQDVDGQAWVPRRGSSEFPA